MSEPPYAEAHLRENIDREQAFFDRYFQEADARRGRWLHGQGGLGRARDRSARPPAGLLGVHVSPPGGHQGPVCTRHRLQKRLDHHLPPHAGASVTGFDVSIWGSN